MKTLTKHLAQSTLLLLIVFALTPLQAQVTATWLNTVSGDEWNTATEWDLGIVPGVATNVNVNSGAVANYNVPMAAPSIGILTLAGTLNVNTTGFNIDAGLSNTAPVSVAGGAILNIASGANMSIANVTNTSLSIAAGGALTNNGTLQFNNSSAITLVNGTPVNAITLNSGSTFTMANTLGAIGMNVGSASSSSQGEILLMNGGSMTMDKLLNVQGAGSAVIINGGTVNLNGGCRINEPNNDNNQRIQITGANNINLGNVSVYRSKTGTGGLLISNSVVNATGIQIGTGNSAAYGIAASGSILTNTGTFTISDNTNASPSGTRVAQFLIRGSSTVVCTGPNGIIIGNQSNQTNTVGITGSNIGGLLDISSGTLITPQLTLIKDSTISNAYARLNLSGGTIYLGSGGLVANTGVSRTAFNIVPSGGTFAATADWSSSAPMTITGTVTFKTADASGAPHNITLTGQISSTGILNKTGTGILTLNTNDTYTGATLVNAGTLAIGASGSIPNTPAIVVASGATVDPTALPNGLPITGAKTLQGLGTVLGTVNVASGGIINPGSNAVTGTLTLGTLVENGGAIYSYFTNSGPNPDFLSLTGDLDVTNVNSIQIIGDVAANTVYPLIQYSGNFNGGITNFSFSGATGSLSNNATTKTIYLVTAAALRAPTNVVWLGNATINVWDTTASTNWLNTGTGNLDFFVPEDNARFDSTGAVNPLVNIPGTVTPASIIVDTTSNYTFLGVGTIGGSSGLTKTNSGTLTLRTTNSYTGQTIVSGGVLEVTNLGISAAPSSIGAAGSDPTNLMLTDTTFRYIGANNNASSDRGATLGDLGVTFDMPNSGVTLTMSGVILGPAPLTKTGPGTLSLTGANVYTNTTVQNGTLAVGASGAGYGNLTNEDGTTLRINSAVTVSNVFNPIGTVIVDLNNTGGNSSMNGAWTGSGTVIISNQNTSPVRLLTIGGNGYGTNGTTGHGDMANFSGTLELGNSPGVLRFNDGGGTINTGSTNMILDMGTSSAWFVSRNGGTTMNFGALKGGPNTIMTGHTSGSGAVTYSIGALGLSTEFDGNIQDANTNAAANPASGPVALTLVGGSLRLTGLTNTYTGDTTINAGTLQVDGNIPYVNGTINLIGFGGGELTGNGVIGGSVAVGAGTTFAPGDGVGVLTISNILTMNPGSTNIFELNATLGSNSKVVGLNGVVYGGNLIITNVAGTLTAGQTFTFFTTLGFDGGSWDSITLPPLGPGLTWDTNQLSVNGSITVVGPPPVPKFTSVLLQAGNIIMSGTNGPTTGNYAILSSTNVATPLTNWTPLFTNAFNGDGTFNATNPIVPGVPREFYILQDVSP